MKKCSNRPILVWVWNLNRPNNISTDMCVTFLHLIIFYYSIIFTLKIIDRYINTHSKHTHVQAHEFMHTHTQSNFIMSLSHIISFWSLNGHTKALCKSHIHEKQIEAIFGIFLFYQNQHIDTDPYKKILCVLCNIGYFWYSSCSFSHFITYFFFCFLRCVLIYQMISRCGLCPHLVVDSL